MASFPQASPPTLYAPIYPPPLLILQSQISECLQAKTARLLSHPLRLRTRLWLLVFPIAAIKYVYGSVCLRHTWWHNSAVEPWLIHVPDALRLSVGGRSVRKPKLPVSIIRLKRERTTSNFIFSDSLFCLLYWIWRCFASPDFLLATVSQLSSQ